MMETFLQVLAAFIGLVTAGLLVWRARARMKMAEAKLAQLAAQPAAPSPARPSLPPIPSEKADISGAYRSPLRVDVDRNTQRLDELDREHDKTRERVATLEGKYNGKH